LVNSPVSGLPLPVLVMALVPQSSNWYLPSPFRLCLIIDSFLVDVMSVGAKGFSPLVPSPVRAAFLDDVPPLALHFVARMDVVWPV